MNSHLSVAQRHKPISNRPASAAERGGVTLTFNKWQFCCLHACMHTAPRLSAASPRKDLPLLTGNPTGLTEVHRGMGEAIHALNSPFDDEPAIGAGTGYLYLNV
jgi:hypothetical protein